MEYRNMSSEQLAEEMEAWYKVISAPKGLEYPSDEVRQQAFSQMSIAEAWFWRKRLEEGNYSE
jgi:hypothetical protein